jgi:hypothetical protein
MHDSLHSRGKDAATARLFYERKSACEKTCVDTAAFLKPLHAAPAAPAAWQGAESAGRHAQQTAPAKR